MSFCFWLDVFQRIPIYLFGVLNERKKFNDDWIYLITTPQFNASSQFRQFSIPNPRITNIIAGQFQVRRTISYNSNTDNNSSCQNSGVSVDAFCLILCLNVFDWLEPAHSEACSVLWGARIFTALETEVHYSHPHFRWKYGV